MITKKTIDFDEELYQAINTLAQENERNFSGQVRFMLREYLKNVSLRDD